MSEVRADWQESRQIAFKTWPTYGELSSVLPDERRAEKRPDWESAVGADKEICRVPAMPCAAAGYLACSLRRFANSRMCFLRH